jgi:hypothetical protein
MGGEIFPSILLCDAGRVRENDSMAVKPYVDVVAVLM